MLSYSSVNAESSNGATVHNGTNETIIDANNNTWTITSNNTINENTSPAEYSAYVVLLLYWNRTIYQTNKDGGWWKWVDSGGSYSWVDTSDPRPSSSSTVTPGQTLVPNTGIDDTSINRKFLNNSIHFY